MNEVAVWDDVEEWSAITYYPPHSIVRYKNELFNAGVIDPISLRVIYPQIGTSPAEHGWTPKVKKW